MSDIPSDLRRFSVVTDTVAAINPYATTSNKKQRCNDLHHGLVHAH